LTLPPKPARKRHRASAPLREALRMGMGRSGRESGYLFGQPLAIGPEILDDSDIVVKF
jgi:hypothetical protein